MVRDKTLRISFAIFSVFVLLYSLLIAQQILLGLLVVFGGLWLYLSLRFLRAFEQIANALRRIAENEAS